MGFDQPLPNNLYSGSYDLRGNVQEPVLTASAGVRVEYTLTAETAGDMVDVVCQFTDAYGVAVTSPVAVWQYLATTAAGQVLDAAPAGGVAVGTNGTILQETDADQIWLAVSEADGLLNVQVTGDTGALADCYLITILPSGLISASDEIVIVAD